MEMQNLADQIEPSLSIRQLGDDGQGNGEWENFAPPALNTRLASQFSVPSYECPSDQIQPTVVLLGMFGRATTGITSFDDDGGTTWDGFVWADDNMFDLSFGTRSYAGVSGAAGDITSPNTVWSNHKGILGNRSDTKFGDILDGSSNTFLFGEIMTQNSTWLGAGGNGLGYAWIGTVSMAMFNWGRESSLEHSRVNGTSSTVAVRSFNSSHPGTANFANADGSVRSVADSADQTTMRDLAGMADGSTASLD